MNGTRLAVALLVPMVFASAMGVVYAKHQTRRLFVELRELERARDEMNIEWGQLQLEQSTWATHGRVEKVARERLGMRIPEPGEVVVITP